MASIETAVETALQKFVQTCEIPDDLLDNLRQSLLSELEKVKDKEKKDKATTSSKKRKNGYNRFISEQFKLAKANGEKSNSQEQMTQFSKQWKTLTDSEKQHYSDLASDGDTEAKPKRKGGINGYNLFYRENSHQIKETKDESVKLATAIGAAWKALPEAQRQDYRDRALEIRKESS